MAESKERFGRYLILDHLVDGGMAKICRARFLGEQADKIVAIKMIQPQYSSDESFKTMFMDEIKVTFGLLHPNIVQTYDYGLHKEQLFVAMEYCDGRNLKEYLDRLRQKKFVFPVEISVYIISQVCQGLHYAHTFTDKLSGKAAQIVHRDISPHNIMLTYDGAVKVIDFGIAKANTNSEATQAGTIKGKLSYLAPEYLDGLNLDPRYDMFAVGITLWEMLCSRKLFKAANDLAVLKKIQECKIPPPSKINPNVPKELDDIVLRALRKDRNKRYENMDQLNRALIKFLYANYPDFNSSDLSYFAKELFKEEIKKDREKLFEFGKIDIMPYIEDWKEEQEGGSAKGKTETSVSSDDSSSSVRKEEQVLDFGFEDESQTHTGLAKRKRAAQTKATGAAKKIDGENLKMSAPPPKKMREPGQRPQGTRTRSRTSGRGGGRTRAGTSTHTGVIDARNLRKDNLKKIFIMTAVLAGVAYFGKDTWLPMIMPQEKPSEVRGPAGDEDEQEITQGTEVITKHMANGIRISNFDSSSHKVFIDGKEVKPDYLKKVPIKTNEEVFLRIERVGYRPYTEKIRVPQGKFYTVKIPPMPAEAFGYLYLSRGCKMFGSLSFELYGEKRNENLPFSSPVGIAFPIEGDGRHPAAENGNAKYTIYYKKPKETIERKITFSFERDGQRINICDL